MSVQVYLNNLEMASQYLARLADELLESSGGGGGGVLERAYFLPSDLAAARACVRTLRAIDERVKSVLRGALDTFFNQALRARVRTLVLDVYRDVSYNLSEDAYGEYEFQDPVRKRFVRLWTTLMAGYSVRVPACWALTRCRLTADLHRTR